MELVKCPICGEMYSESYKSCPFCAESGPFEGTVKHRRIPGRRLEHRKNPRILGPAMILVVLLLAAVLVYAFFGDQIRERFRKDPVDDPSVVEVQLTVEPASMELAVGEIRALTASGAAGYMWSSSDETVATVDEQGGVTAVGTGVATITVTDKWEEHSARCEVTVREPGDEPVNPNPDSGNEDPTPAKKLTMCAQWNGKELPTATVDGETMYDMTLGRGSTILYIDGTDSDVYWSSSSAAVTVSSNGTVTRVSRGTAYITATVDGQTLKCRVLG